MANIVEPEALTKESSVFLQIMELKHSFKMSHLKEKVFLELLPDFKVRRPKNCQLEGEKILQAGSLISIYRPRLSRHLWFAL